METIPFDTFTSVDIRAARVVDAEKIKKSKKLLKITVDLGQETRTIVSGISEHFTPEQINGKTVAVVAILAPSKKMGIGSKGMILKGDDTDCKLHLCEYVLEHD